jgi:ribonuclease P/MRP protein subunit POP5
VKHLPKHLQPRWRYLAVGIETWPDAALDRDQFQRALWYSAQNLLGDVGSADADLTLFGFSHADGSGEAVVRTRRDSVEQARGIITAIDSVDGVAVGIRVRGVSGTVRACEEKYMGRGREGTDQRHVVFGDAERSAFVRDGRVDVQTDEAFAGATTLDIH